MKKALFLISLILISMLVVGQVSAVFAAPARAHGEIITGVIQRIEVITDTNTGATTVFVTVEDNNRTFRVQFSLEAVLSDPDQDLVTVDENGNTIINTDALGTTIEIDPTTMIVEAQHPVGSALATFFGVEYDDIMTYHESGSGFGVITQALWLSKKVADPTATPEELEALFLAVMDARNNDNYSAFFEPGETVPANWGQFRKALLDDDKKVNLGAIMSQQGNGTDNTPPNNENHGNAGGNGNGGGNNNGNHNGSGNGNGGGNGNSNGNGN